ncbi:hypothetical protein DSM106972_027540 [Dulcicalothrix desertica PCC 7102]|uniref:Transposase n=1 Tax=Dulcicalothrix desertica PCC 7102 TaxID=232991 RepID=A0A3S1CNR4_9CYAN|nr:hypothetical protein DSM106972_027540 [Dulcicalothrix desertica PCC 7102]
MTITDFDMFENSNKVISRYKLKEKDDLTDYSDDIELVFVELPKFNKQLSELETLSDKWLYFLKAANTLESVPASMEEVPEINHAFEVARESKLTRKELELLEKREMFLHDSKNAILKARQDGKQEGAKEKAIEIARSLIGILDVQTISQTIGLSVAEVERLRN